MRDDTSRPVALLVTRNFPPLLGGMEKVNQHLLAALEPEWRPALCGPAGCACYVPPHTEVKQNRIKPLLAFLLGTLWHAVHMAWRRKPEWVIAGSGITAPIAWLAARSGGSRAAVYLHGLDIVVSSRVYRWLWLPFILRCDLVLANSANTAKLARDRGVPSSRLHILHPGTHLPELSATAGRAFRNRFGFGERPLLLSVGRLTQRKGLVEFVAKALPAILAHYPDALLLVIGDEATDALHARSGSERDRILDAARNSGIEKSLHFFGRSDEETLGAAYQAADAHIFPVLELAGDVEGFGMVALEAAAHGLPTIAFAVGGVCEAVQNGSTGTLVEPNDYGNLGKAVIHQLAHVRDDSVTGACRQFAAAKAWPIFGERLRKLLRESNV